MNVIFWENIISPHKLPYWREISWVNDEYKCIVVVPTLMSSDRINQGWGISEVGTVQIVNNPSDFEILNILNLPDSIHIFSGIHSNPLVRKALNRSLKLNIRRVLLTESVNLNGSRKLTRRLASLFYERKYRKYFEFVLASSINAVQWYHECGYNRDIVFPFSYCVEHYNLSSFLKFQSDNGPFKFLFIGQLIKRKGIDLLIQCLGEIKAKKWHLNIYGSGEMEKDLRRLVLKKNLNDKVSFYGNLKINEVRRIYYEHDLLILPSRFDGWGAVINESLMSGTPVLCSTACGAKDLVEASGGGQTFKSNSKSDLKKELIKVLNKGKPDSEQRKRLVNWSNSIEGKSIAKYLINIIEHIYGNIEKPYPPFLRKKML